jgi:RNA polymerase sigma-54 factor
MSLGQRLDLRQSQQLVMTPQLQQAIKMLQMSNLELSDFVEGELQKNPLLERVEENSDQKAQIRESARDHVDVAVNSDRLSKTEDVFDNGSENLFADEARADRATAETQSAPLVESAGGFEAQEGSAWSQVGSGGSSKFDDIDGGLEARAAAEITLREFLLAQLGQTVTSRMHGMIASHLIEQLDEAGYLLSSLDDVALRLGAYIGDVEIALDIVQKLEPTGVGARSLKECLALQLIEKDRLDPAMRILVDNLELLAACKFPRLRSVCKVDDEDLRDMITDLKALDPKPGLRYASDFVQMVAPDVYVFENKFGGWQVELNTDTLPRVLLNKTYAADVMRGQGASRDDSIKEYLTECQQNASWLIKSIDQRAKTILRVASEIVRQQDGFFAFGVNDLRPLNLKQVADAIEMHESTVSRVTSNKFIGTPRGIFEMKYFFTPAIASTDGGASYSAESIRHKIKGLVEKEGEKSTLSDDKIVSILRNDGIDIARRTVTKYREAMGIPSSIKRRRLKAAVTMR